MFRWPSAMKKHRFILKTYTEYNRYNLFTTTTRSSYHLKFLLLEGESNSNENKRDWMPYIEAFTVLVALGIIAAVVKIIVKNLVARNANNEISLDTASQSDGTFLCVFHYLFL